MKTSFLLFIFLSVQVTFAKDSLARKTPVLQDKGYLFDLPKITKTCQTEAKCQERAIELCRSKKAKLSSCEEQYKGAWITTCECVK